MRERPAYYAPVWAPDGTKLTYVAARPDGRLALRRVDIEAHEGGELAASRLPDPPVAMALSPDGAKVACAVLARPKGQQATVRLHVLSRGGSSDRVVWETPSRQGVVDLCWTPDGGAIVVAADQPVGSGLWRVAADGSGATVLADDLHGVRAPAVSPDGRSVAFVACKRPEALWSLQVRSHDGRRKVAASGVFRTYRVGYWPRWSPRGNGHLAYVAERYAAAGFAEVWVWDAATGRRRPLARTLAGACLAPAWSPKGDRLAFVRLPLGMGTEGPGTNGRPAEIVLADPAGKKLRPLVADGLANLMPAWAPDGATIAFCTCADPSDSPHVVRLVDVETAKVRLAEDSPAARFALALARHERGSATALTQAAAELARITSPTTLPYAHDRLARIYERRGRWQLVARHAAAAEAAGGLAIRANVLRLLAQAQMRLGQPEAALAAANRLTAVAPDAARALRDGLRTGIQAVATCQAELRRKPTAPTLHRMADAERTHLGDPRRALDQYCRLIDDFPDYPRRAEAAASAFQCYAQLAPEPPGYRVLQRVAAALGTAPVQPGHVLLLAEAAAEAGRADDALRWLDRLPAGTASDRAVAVCLRAAEHLQTRGATDEALAAWARAIRSGSAATAAQASLAAGKLLAEKGRHQEAIRHLVAALQGRPDVATMREALRLLTRGRLQRADPVAYDTARVAEMVLFGYLDSAVDLGEQVISGLGPQDPRRDDVRRPLADGFERLTRYHLAKDNVPAARAAVNRWLRRASPNADLPRALAALAVCQTAIGNRQALVETLSRLTLEFPATPQAAAARRQLLMLDTARRR